MKLLLSVDGLPVQLAAVWHQVSMMVKLVVEPRGRASQLGRQWLSFQVQAVKIHSNLRLVPTPPSDVWLKTAISRILAGS